MASIKTSVSIEEELLGKVEELAKSDSISRSEVLNQALRNFFDVRKNAQLLKQLNAVYGEDVETVEEKRFRRAANQKLVRRGKEKW